MLKVNFGIISSNKELKKNNNNEIVNEDSLFVDEKSQVFIVADGISRLNSDIVEYKDGKTYAKDVADKFCNLIGNKLINRPKLPHFEYLAYLKDTYIEANASIKSILDNIQAKFQEVPGCVGLAAFIENDILYFGAIGDCVGILIRNNQKFIFASKQTEGVVKYYKPTTSQNDRTMLYSQFVNKVGIPFSYGVFNGDDTSQFFFNPSYLKLEDNDIIYIMSDGISDYILYEDFQNYQQLSIDDIFANQIALLKLFNNEIYDDMALIQIKYKA